MPDHDMNVPDRMLNSLYRIVKQFFPKYEFLGFYRYRVVSMETLGDRVNLQVIKKESNLPDMLSIDMYPGIPGVFSEPALGSTVLVSFIDGDPAYPIITHFERKGQPGFIPLTTNIDATTLLKLGESAASIQLGDIDQQTIARYPAIAAWATQVTAYITAVSTILQGTVLITPAGSPVVSLSGTLPPVSPLSPAAASSKVTSQ